MADRIDTENIDSLSGAVYFVVGRGTEGGASSSYRLSVAGVGDSDWGDVDAVASDSGYSIGTIQVDLGQQGLRALGATDDRKVRPGEKTYVDAIIEQSANYAKSNGLKFPDDVDGLREDLLSHGDGKGRHPSIRFISKDTLVSINRWASSTEGKRWIHQNIDYPQIKKITEKAVALLDEHGKNIPENRRFEAICILAKTGNQMPGKMRGYERILREGGSYDEVLQHANDLSAAVRYYDGPKAAAVAARYAKEYTSPGKKESLDRVQAKVSGSSYDPSKEESDPDVQEALRAIGGSTHNREVLRLGAHSAHVSALQSQLAHLGYVDARGRSLRADGDFGPSTHVAMQAFQRDHDLVADGLAGPATMSALHRAVQASQEPTVDALQVEAIGRPDTHATRTLQQNLNTLGATDMRGKPLAVDGIFGVATQTAVARFQSGHGLPITGQADEATRSMVQGQAFIAELQQASESHSFRPSEQSQVTHTLYDPRHPDSPTHRLYNALEQCIPGASENRLLQFTAACHKNMITADNLSTVHVDEERMTIDFRGTGPLSTPAQVDLSVPPPKPQEAIQQIQQFDQQEMQLGQAYQMQSAQLSQGGPRL